MANMNKGKENGRSQTKLLDASIGIEEKERRDREEKIKSLLDDDDEDVLIGMVLLRAF